MISLADNRRYQALIGAYDDDGRALLLQSFFFVIRSALMRHHGMAKPIKPMKKTSKKIDAHFSLKKWNKSWTYIKTVIDIVREPILILDKNFRVVFANKPFYQIFQVKLSETKGKAVYSLGNGQWDIPDLRKLLEKILPKHTFFKGFKVDHVFPTIGRKVMLLNARQIHVEEKPDSHEFSPIILLAIEDITNMIMVAEAVAGRIGNR